MKAKLSIRNWNILACMLMFYHVSSQEIHFTQFNENQLFTNPSLTGNTDNGNLNFGASYRTQLLDFDNAYNTFSAHGQLRIIPNYNKNDHIGLGLLFLNDAAGSGALSNTGAYVTFAYKKGFTRLYRLNVQLGASLGVVNKAIDYSKLTFDNQWDGNGFDPGLPSNENYQNNTFYYADFNVGASIIYSNPKTKFITGFSIFHLNQPTTSFYNDKSQTLKPKHTVHIKFDRSIDEHLQISTGILYTSLTKNNELVGGGNVEYIKKSNKLIIGLWYRWNRDIIPVAGYQIDDYRIILSYDVNVSNNITGFNSSFEISINKTFFSKRLNPPCFNVNF